MRKLGYQGLFILFFISIIFSVVSAQEQITITTYYPSPYGSYAELRADRVSVGSGYRTAVIPADGLIIQGNVGIGVTTPSRRLSVVGIPVINGDNRSIAVFLDDSPLAAGIGGGIEFGGHNNTTGSFAEWAGIKSIKDNNSSGTGASMAFMTRTASSATQERMRITSSGNVGIGATAPADRLEVNGNISLKSNVNPGDGPSVRFYSHSTTTIPWEIDSYYYDLDPNHSYLRFFRSDIGSALAIAYNGNVGIGTSPSPVINNRLTVDGNVIFLNGLVNFGSRVRFSDGLDVYQGLQSYGGIHSNMDIEATGNFIAHGPKSAIDRDLQVGGTLTAAVKSFAIAHPTKPGMQLVHACIEGPESGVYYRGEAGLTNGRAKVKLPDYFEALARKDGRTIQLTAKGIEPFLLSYTDIVNGEFTIYGSKPDGKFSWEVKAARADIEPLVVEKPAKK